MESDSQASALLLTKSLAEGTTGSYSELKSKYEDNSIFTHDLGDVDKFPPNFIRLLCVGEQILSINETSTESVKSYSNTSSVMSSKPRFNGAMVDF